MEQWQVSISTSLHKAIAIYKTLTIKVKGWMIEKGEKSFICVYKWRWKGQSSNTLQSKKQNIVITGESAHMHLRERQWMIGFLTGTKGGAA